LLIQVDKYENSSSVRSNVDIVIFPLLIQVNGYLSNLVTKTFAPIINNLGTGQSIVPAQSLAVENNPDKS